MDKNIFYVQDLCWNLFLETGAINYYLLYKQLLNFKEQTFDKENEQGLSL